MRNSVMKPIPLKIQALTATRCHIAITWNNNKREVFCIPSIKISPAREKVNKVCGK